MLRCLSCLMAACLCIGLGAVHARVRAQPAPLFDPAPLLAPPLQATAPGPLPLQASPAVPPPLRAAGSVEPPVLRAPEPDNLAQEAELTRLRALAQTPANAGGRATRGQANAAWVLGLLYLHGIGVAANPREAASWFERAYALGEPLAPAGLAWCELEGCKNPPNPVAARRWVAQLRGANLPRAHYLQWLIETRLSPLQLSTPPLRQEPTLSPLAPLPARQLLLSAAQGGDIHARIELGLESVAGNRPTEALAYFQAAAARSPAAAANAELITQRLRPASASRLPADDTLAQAQRNHRGLGQPANFVEAIRLYRLAQNQGSQEAKKMLELIFSRPGPNGQVDVAWMQELAYLNLSGKAPALDSATSRSALRREPTPLFDLLPPSWQKNSNTAPRPVR